MQNVHRKLICSLSNGYTYPRDRLHVDDVSVDEFPGVRDAVADDFVHARAHALRELAVVERARVRVIFYTCIVHEDVNFLRGDSRFRERARPVQDGRRERARFSHCCFILRLFCDLRGIVPRRRHACVCVRRFSDGCGYESHGRHIKRY